MTVTIVYRRSGSKTGVAVVERLADEHLTDAGLLKNAKHCAIWMA
jgi:hypothetical protein